MPQFDFSTYSAQIFWFGFCFFVLYYFMANVILPRIRNIIAERKTVINDDLSSAAGFNNDANEKISNADNVLIEANLKYKTALDEAVKSANSQREKALHDFKENADKMIKKTQSEIIKMVEESHKNSEKAVEQLVSMTQNKILN